MAKPRSSLRDLYRRAFFNQYNMILIGGTALFALTTFSWLPLLIGAGMEVLWMALGPDTTLFKRWVAAQETREEREALKHEVAQAMELLDKAYLQRFAHLQELGEEVQALARGNESLAAPLIEEEMSKLGELMHSFLQMAVVHQRLSRYLQESTAREIRRDIEECEQALGRERDAEVVMSLRQGLVLAEKRLAQHERIASSCKALGVKMQTIEKSFLYLKSHILGISRSEELSDEIAQLISGVESVAALSAETEGIIAELSRGAPARRAVIKAKA